MSGEEVKSFPTPGIATQREIFEQVESGHFLVWDRIEQKAIVHSSDVWRFYVIDGVKYVPLLRLPWAPAATLDFYQSETQLFNEIRQFFVDHLDVQNELFYDVYACFVLASWRCEDFKVVPYLFFLGPLSSGKTRALECLQRLCYRGIIASSMSAASLFRALEAWHPTLFLDESEIYNRKEMVEVLALLNSGYRKGQYAIRVEKVEEGTPVIAMFDTFGFKGIAGTEELAATLQSRCIITPMSRAVRPINLFIDEEKAQKLRDQLLFYRFRNLGRNVDCDVSEFAKENGFFQNARVIELFISLIQVAPNAEVKNRLIACMRQITQSRLDEEQASIEARVFEAILKCEDLVENGKISTEAITAAFNKGLTEKDQGTSRFIGRKVTALGFEKCRVGNEGKAGFYWDTKLIARLKARYYPNSTSETSETSETSASMEKPNTALLKNAEVTEEISSVSFLPESQNTMKTEVSEETEVTEVNLEGVPENRKIYYRILSPTEPRQCEGEGTGDQCTLLAKYECSSKDNPLKFCYCESHFQNIRKSCRENGYLLINSGGAADEL